MTKVLGILLAVVVILGGGGYLLATRANASTPADPLFTLDTFFEDAQRLVTLDDVAKTELEQEILEERQEEVEVMLESEDVSEEEIGEAVDCMNEQRIKTYERLGEVQEKMEQKGNTEAVQNLEKVQNQYMENLQKQLETATKVQNKFNGAAEEVKEEIQMSIQQGSDTTQNNSDTEKGNSSSTKGNN